MAMSKIPSRVLQNVMGLYSYNDPLPTVNMTTSLTYPTHDPILTTAVIPTPNIYEGGTPLKTSQGTSGKNPGSTVKVPDWDNPLKNHDRMLMLILRVALPEEEGGLPIDNKDFEDGYRHFSNFRHATLATALQFQREGRNTRLPPIQRGKAQNRLDKLEKAMIRVGGKKAVYGIRQFVPGGSIPKEISQPPQRWKEVEYWTHLVVALMRNFIM